MLNRIEGNGVRTIIMETAHRFARDLMVQEVGYTLLQGRGIELIVTDSPQAFLDEGPTARLIRQVLGAVAEFEKAMTVAKLRGARERKRATGVKVEDRKRIAERKTDDGRAIGAEIVAEAKRLRRKRPKGAGSGRCGRLRLSWRPRATSTRRGGRFRPRRSRQ
jgi:DNA invertase Pin-like site-specific DNA recombinase